MFLNFLNGFNLRYHAFHRVLDAVFQSLRAMRTVGAMPRELHPHRHVVVQTHKLHSAAIGLQIRLDLRQNILDFSFNNFFFHL